MLKQIGQYAFSHKKTVMLALLISVFVSSGFDYAYAQTTATASLTAGGIYLVIFIAAGVTWSLSGYTNGIRSHANYLQAHGGQNIPPDPDWRGFDPTAMKDDVFIGTILGVISFVTNASTGTIPAIDSMPTLFAALISAYGLIGVTDKVGVGAILNR